MKRKKFEQLKEIIAYNRNIVVSGCGNGRCANPFCKSNTRNHGQTYNDAEASKLALKMTISKQPKCAIINEQSKNLKIQSLDLTVFKNTENNKCEWNSNNCLKSCSALERIVVCLRYYSALNLYENVDRMDVFSSFIADIYSTQLLDDWTHILFKHEAHLHQIQQTLIENSPCSVEKCNFMHRHHQNKEIKEYAQFDTISSVYAQVLDAAHFHLFHLFDVGMRSLIIDNDNDSDENDRFYDAKFAQMIERVNGKRSHTQKFERFEVCNKFNLVQDEVKESNTTFLDELIKHLSDSGAGIEYILLFKIFVFDQEYDSDSVQYDIELNKGNISEQIENEKAIECIKNFIAIIKCMLFCNYLFHSFVSMQCNKQRNQNYSLSDIVFIIGQSIKK